MRVRSSRLPRWFTWWVPVQVTIALVPAIILTLAIAAAIPLEDVPGIARLQDGSTAYRALSLHELVLPYVFMVLLIPFGVIAVRACPPPRDYVRRKAQTWPRPAPAMRIIGSVVGYGALAILGVVLLLGAVASLCCRVKTVIVTKDVVLAESVLSSRHIPRADITRVHLCCDKQRARVNVRLDLQRRDGKWHAILEREFDDTDAELPRYVDVMRQLENHINQDLNP